MSKLVVFAMILFAVGIVISLLPIFAMIAHMVVGLTRMVWGI